MISVKALDHIVLNVRDVDISAAWYQQILGMTREDHRAGSVVRTSLRFGDQKINLRPIGSSQDEWFTAHHPAPGSDDLCFLVDAPPEEVVRHLTENAVAVEVGPVTKRGALGPLASVYCRDPDGSLIEIASYPARTAGR